MSIEHASMQAVRKPWGSPDLRPWSGIDGTGDRSENSGLSAPTGNAPVRPCF